MVRPYKRVLSEDFTLSHTTAAGNVWQVKSSTGNTWLPGRLLTIDGNTESLDLSLFATKNEVSWKRRAGRFYWTQKVGFDARRQEIVGHNWGVLQPWLQPEVQMTFGRHRLDGAVKLSYIRQSLDDGHSSFAGIEPSFRWDWKLSPKSEFFVNYRLSANPVEGIRLIGEPLYTDYRHQQVGTGEPGMQYTHSLVGTYSYRNPVSGIFFNLQPMYLHRDGNILYETGMNASTITQTATEQRYGSDTWQMGGRLSKSFSRPRAVVGISASASTSDYCYLSGGAVSRASVNVLSASADYSVRPASWLSVEGASGVAATRRVQGESASEWIRDWSHRLGVNVLPARGWMVSLDNELYHSSERDFGVNFFSDLSVGYRAKRWELTCKATNIFGTSEYQRVRVSSTVQSWSMTYLRPRGYLVKFSVDL